ncbi:DUF4944 domain-containing protein [Neobacillus drentensis]|uniref:DUF4944 domain-containing protein n=1 Tax=Neobacillus drentensis TaxID=220684 RepID=UPI002FFE13BF
MAGKRLFLFILIAVLLIAVTGWKIYDYRQWNYPRWEGASDDGNWKAVIAQDKNAMKDSLFGNVYWKGNKNEVSKTYIKFIQLRVDGKYYIGDKKKRTEKSQQKINPMNLSFLDWDGAESFENKKLVVELHWKKNGQEKNTKIELKKVEE